MNEQKKISQDLRNVAVEKKGGVTYTWLCDFCLLKSNINERSIRDCLEPTYPFASG